MPHQLKFRKEMISMKSVDISQISCAHNKPKQRSNDHWGIGATKHPSSALTLLGCGSSSTVLVCIMGFVAVAVIVAEEGWRRMEGGEGDIVAVVERRRPAESTDCGAAGGELPILSRCGMRVWLWLLQIRCHLNKGSQC